VYRVVCQLDFCYGHRLLHYAGKCRHLHGHNGRVRITLDADCLDHLGMVCDFTEIKRTLGAWIDENLDHRMILHQDDPAIAPLTGLGEPLVVVPHNPTAEYLARMIFDAAVQLHLPVVGVEIWETPRCCAAYGAGVRDGRAP